MILLQDLTPKLMAVTPENYWIFLITMTVIALFVFIALHFVKAGYGYLYNPKFGFPIPNKIAWVIMEAPVFIAMWALWYYLGDMTTELAPMVLFSIIQIHYFQRSFIFPMLIRGNSKMPVTIMLMGATFNTLNALMQGGWLFYFAPKDYYADWFSKPFIYIGVAVWLFGFITNLHSDYIIRHLRKPGDKKHYIPRGGMFRFVSSANYFGEFMEWVGYAIASWSWAGLVFAWWTFANLAPRAFDLYKRYEEEFGEEFTKLKRKRIIPFIY